MPNNFLSQIGQQLIKWGGGRVPFAPGAFLPPVWGASTTEVYANLTYHNAITEGFTKNSTVYSLIMKDANKFASIPRYLYNKERKGVSPSRFEGVNDLTKLLEYPNPGQAQDEFFCLWRVLFKAQGEAFIWLNRGDTSMLQEGEFIEIDDTAQQKKKVLEMYLIPADKIIVVPDPTNPWGVYGYILESGTGRVPLRKVDIIHLRMPNPEFDAGSRSHLRGLSPLQPGSVDVELSASTSKSMLRGVQNDGSKGAMFNKSMQKMTPEQESQVRKVVDKKANGMDIKNLVATIQGDWGYIDFGRTAVEMETIAGMQMADQKLCLLLDVPYELVDPKTTFANKKEAQKGWVSNSIYPACKQLDGALNRVLLMAFGLEASTYIGSDISDLPEMQIDLAGTATALASAWWLSPNEKRAIMMQEKLPETIYDELWIPGGISAQSEREDAAMMEQEALTYEQQSNSAAVNQAGEE